MMPTQHDAFVDTDPDADAHHLPFPEHYFDCVISQGMLEHTKDSDRVVAEMFRVLKPGGLVYAEAPFLAPGHMEHSDFRRFTQGHDTLFGGFDKVHSGVNGSGMSALCWLGVQTWSSALSFGNDSLYWAVKIALTFLFLPLKYLEDILLVKLPQAPLMAAGNYFLGRKPAASR